MRRAFAGFLVMLLVALWSTGTFIAAICECAHGPEVECECPHHLGGSGDDADLPPCHRAAAQKRREQDRTASKEGPASLKNKCGASPARLLQLPVTQVRAPLLALPEPLPEPKRRWDGFAAPLCDFASRIDPPPPRAA